MDAALSPFPRAWLGIALEGLGFDRLRARQGTYGLYGFDALPALPEVMPGGLAWLAAAPDAPEWAITGAEPDTAEALACLSAAGHALPATFVDVMSSPALQGKVRSWTGCFVDLCPAASRIDEGHLIRFLSDQQGCFFWYLYLSPAGEQAVVASGFLYGTPEEEALDSDRGDAEARTIWFCAPSFDVFLRRFWLENEIAYAFRSEAAGLPPPPGTQDYVEAYRRIARRMPSGGAV